MSLIFSLPPSVPSSRRNGIYIGGKDDAKNRAKLEQWGVTHVINMTPVKDSSIQVSLYLLLYCIRSFVRSLLFTCTTQIVICQHVYETN